VHETEQCGFRRVVCKFEPLGCQWEGRFHQLQEHQKSCEVRNTSIKKLLKKVRERDGRKAAKEKQIRDQMASFSSVCNLLSSRCRDVIIRDVVIEKDQLSQEQCSKTFTALGVAWEAVLVEKKAMQCPGKHSVRRFQTCHNSFDCDNCNQSFNSGAIMYGCRTCNWDICTDCYVEKRINDQQQIGFFLRVVSSIKKKLKLKIFVLKGPNMSEGLLAGATTQTTMFSRKTRHSDVLVLPFPEKEVLNILESDSVSLRVGFVDVSHGQIARGFTSVNSAAHSDEFESSSSDTDPEGGEIDIPVEYQDGGRYYPPSPSYSPYSISPSLDHLGHSSPE